MYRQFYCIKFIPDINEKKSKKVKISNLFCLARTCQSSKQTKQKKQVYKNLHLKASHLFLRKTREYRTCLCKFKQENGIWSAQLGICYLNETYQNSRFTLFNRFRIVSFFSGLSSMVKKLCVLVSYFIIILHNYSLLLTRPVPEFTNVSSLDSET